MKTTVTHNVHTACQAHSAAKLWQHISATPVYRLANQLVHKHASNNGAVLQAGAGAHRLLCRICIQALVGVERAAQDTTII
jgi:hypothetical protein